MCVNWKAVGAVVGAAVAMVLFAPSWAAASAPLLVVAICPLSMWLMMRHMRRPAMPHVTDMSDRAEIERLRSEVAELRQQRSSVGRAPEPDSL